MGFTDLRKLFSLLEEQNPHFRNHLNDVLYCSVHLNMTEVVRALLNVYREGRNRAVTLFMSYC